MTVHYSKITPPEDREPVEASPLIIKHLMFRLDKAARLMAQAEDEINLIRRFLEEMERGR